MASLLAFTWTGLAPGTTAVELIYGYPQNAYVGHSIQAFNPDAFPGIPGGEPVVTLDVRSTVYRNPNTLTTIPAYILTVTNVSGNVSATVLLSVFLQPYG